MKFLIKTLSFSLLIFFSVQSLAVTVSDGIDASKNNDQAGAVKIWAQLASAGNPVAQYNLANHYSAGKGIQKNESMAEQWLRDATHSGLIQAYTNLNKEGVTPANGITLSFNISPKLWLEKQEPKLSEKAGIWQHSSLICWSGESMPTRRWKRVRIACHY